MLFLAVKGFRGMLTKRLKGSRQLLPYPMAGSITTCPVYPGRGAPVVRLIAGTYRNYALGATQGQSTPQAGSLLHMGQPALSSTSGQTFYSMSGISLIHPRRPNVVSVQR